MKKVIFTIAMLAAGIFSANAQSANPEASLSLSTETETVAKGAEVTIAVTLKTNFQANGYQFDIILPEGLSYVKNAGGAALTTKGPGTPSYLSLGKSFYGNDYTLRLIGYENAEYITEEGIALSSIVCTGCMDADGCVIVSFKVATVNATAGDYVIDFKTTDLSISDNTNPNNNVAVTPTTTSLTITVEDPTYKLVFNGTEYTMTDAGEGVYTYNTADKIPANTTDGYTILVKYGDTTYGAAAEAAAISKTNTNVALTEGTTAYAMESDTQAAYYGFTLTVAEGGALNLAVDYSGQWPTGCDNVDAATAEKLFRDGKVIIRRNGTDYTVMGQKL